MAFPIKRPSDLAATLGLGKRGGPPPVWDAPSDAALVEPSVEPAGGECTACCKQMADCKFYEPNVPKPEEAPTLSADDADAELGIKD